LQIIAVQQESYYGSNYVIPAIKYPRNCYFNIYVSCIGRHNLIFIKYIVLETEMTPFTMNQMSIGVGSVLTEHLKPLANVDNTPLSIVQLTEMLQDR
jgi:hypothetical protein